MSIQIPTQANSQQPTPIKQSTAPQENAQTAPLETTAAQQKHQSNLQIVEASLQVSIKTGNESMSLVYKAALEKLNEILAPALNDPNPIKSTYESGLDTSPEATAERIVSLTTGLYSRYQEANPDLTEDELNNRFMETIGKGIQQGFDEAREILDGLGVLEGEIADNIDKTFELVQEKLNEFRDSLNQPEQQEDSDEHNRVEVTEPS